MTVGEILRKYPRLETELLLGHVLNKPKEFVYSHSEIKLKNKQADNLNRLVKRRKNDEPMAYILGYKDFYGLRFKVNRHVLIPRPETEELVELVLQHLSQRKSSKGSLKILDIGTGSGCVIISLARLLTRVPLVNKGHPCQAKFYASDISSGALAVAKENAKAHKAKIKFARSDLCSRLPGRFDILVANLPYVTARDYKRSFHELRFEPKLALTDATDTWQIYERLFSQLKSRISPQAKIFLEINPNSRKRLAQYCLQYLPAAKLQFEKDLAGKFRFAIIQKPWPLRVRELIPKNSTRTAVV